MRSSPELPSLAIALPLSVNSLVRFPAATGTATVRLTRESTRTRIKKTVILPRKRPKSHVYAPGSIRLDSPHRDLPCPPPFSFHVLRQTRSRRSSRPQYLAPAVAHFPRSHPVVAVTLVSHLSRPLCGGSGGLETVSGAPDPISSPAQRLDAWLNPCRPAWRPLSFSSSFITPR